MNFKSFLLRIIVENKYMKKQARNTVNTSARFLIKQR